MDDSAAPLPWSRLRFLGFDIDGTLTDGTTTWLGPEVGWSQRYSTRDGEAFRRLREQGLSLVPISRNGTTVARERMQMLDMPLDWLGVTDKKAAFRAALDRFGATASEALYVGDGPDDVPLVTLAAVGCAVADGHPDVRRAADLTLTSRGGDRVIEEIELRLQGRWPDGRDGL